MHFFIAEYSDAQRTTSGGGVDDEAIEVLELPLAALQMVADGRSATVRRSFCCNICKPPA